MRPPGNRVRGRAYRAPLEIGAGILPLPVRERQAMKKTMKKLTISKETLRALTAPEAQAAVAGGGTDTCRTCESICDYCTN
jgi:hypothetical protein